MTTDDGTLLLVGSVARPEDGWSVEDVLRHCASALGEYVTMLPDGEVGDRNQSITYIARHAYHGNPALRTVSRHTYEDWKPRGYNDQWRFAVQDGVEEIHFDAIGYADEAKASYGVFRRLREEGVIRHGVRFWSPIPARRARSARSLAARESSSWWRARTTTLSGVRSRISCRPSPTMISRSNSISLARRRPSSTSSSTFQMRTSDASPGTRWSAIAVR